MVMLEFSFGKRGVAQGELVKMSCHTCWTRVRRAGKTFVIKRHLIKNNVKVIK